MTTKIKLVTRISFIRIPVTLPVPILVVAIALFCFDDSRLKFKVAHNSIPQIVITGLSTNNGVDEQGPNTVIRKPVSTLPCYPYIFKIMHLMYYLDAGGKRVYTLKVTQL